MTGAERDPIRVRGGYIGRRPDAGRACPPFAAQAQPAVGTPVAKPAVQAAPQTVPGFWDPRHRPERPDLSPPHRDPVSDRDRLSPVQLRRRGRQPRRLQCRSRRALCDEIKVSCTVQMRRFETLVDAITTNKGDAIIASLAVTPELRTRPRFHRPPITGRRRVSCRAATAS